MGVSVDTKPGQVAQAKKGEQEQPSSPSSESCDGAVIDSLACSSPVQQGVNAATATRRASINAGNRTTVLR